MTAEQYEQMVTAAIAKAAEGLGRNPSPARTEHVLTVLAQTAASLSRDYHLLNLITAAELAERWGVTHRAARALAARRHAQFGTGRLVGKTWLFDIDEIPLLEQDFRRRD